MANAIVKVIYHQNFVKHFQKRIGNNISLLSSYKKRFRLFSFDRNHPLLKDHRLTGDLGGKRSFWVTGDIRVIYRENIPGVVEFMDIGSHNQVYR